MDGRYFGQRIVGSTRDRARMDALDAADGVMDGRFYGQQILGEVPVYKTGCWSSCGSVGLTGAVGGLSSSYPSLGAYAGLQSSSYAYPTLSSSYLGSSALVGGYDLACGSSYSAFGSAIGSGYLSSYAAPVVASAYESVPCQFVSCQQSIPVVACQQQPVQISCPPPPPVQVIESAPKIHVVQTPPQVLQLPCPCPPPPCPLPPPPPSVIHIKDDNGPKVASLQAEIRRLERLLGAAKETEAQLRNEIAELQRKIEIWAQKDAQLAQCEAELARLREQLMEAQRRIVFLEGQRDEAHKHIAFLESQLKAADEKIAQMAGHIRALEQEIANLRMRLEVKQEVHSHTNITETYKVKTFEMAAKLAGMDGSDDGLYNGLPIEIEGEGLYRDLVKAGRRVKENISLTGRPTGSMTTMTETYKVQNWEMAEKLSKMGGTDDGKYNGLPIEIVGQGLYTEVRARGGGVRTSSPPRVVSTGAAGAASATVKTTGSVTGGQTYKVSNMEMAAKISRMGGADDGTYKGLPIEVQGMGLYRDLRGRQ